MATNGSYNPPGIALDTPLITTIPDSALTAEQALSLLGTGILKVSSGVLSAAVGADLPSHAHAAGDITSGQVIVAQGGTGVASLTANSLIVGAGTSAVTFVAPGTAGNVLTSVAGVWVSQAPAAAGAPTDATYITQTPSSGLSNEQALSGLATGLLKNTTGTGVLTAAVPGTDFIAPYTTQTASFALIAPTAGGVPTFRALTGVDLTAALASPPAIGGTTPAAVSSTIFRAPVIAPNAADSTTAITFNKFDGTTVVATLDTTNSRFGIGVTPTATFHGLVADANTASSINMLALAHNLSSGTAAAGIGTNITFAGHTSGSGASANNQIGKIDATFSTTNHPTRAGTVTISANYAGTAQPIIAVTGESTGYGKLAFFNQPGHVAYPYISRGFNTVIAAYTATPASLGLAATLADLNLLRAEHVKVALAMNDWNQASLGYGLWFDQS